jgi:hypothetical protein
MARTKPLQCPFCDNYLRAPIDINVKGTEVTGGICTCGARTGHNVGDIFMDGLTFVCRGDIDKALSLGPEDYESEEYDYDIHTNTTGRTSKSGKTGIIVFIRLLNR